MYAEERAAYISYLVNEWCVVIRGADAYYHFGDEMIFKPPILPCNCEQNEFFCSGIFVPSVLRGLWRSKLAKAHSAVADNEKSVFFRRLF